MPYFCWIDSVDMLLMFNSRWCVLNNREQKCSKSEKGVVKSPSIFDSLSLSLSPLQNQATPFSESSTQSHPTASEKFPPKRGGGRDLDNGLAEPDRQLICTAKNLLMSYGPPPSPLAWYRRQYTVIQFWTMSWIDHRLIYEASGLNRLAYHLLFTS